MAMYVTPTLEFSPDALSDTTPTYTDVTPYLLEATWSAGVQKEGDAPSPGQAQFVLDDRTRRFEPDYAAGAFYPGIVPDRRFRLQVVSSAVTYEEGTWYAAQWQPSWPDAAVNQLSTVTCGDGMQVLAFDTLPSLDPPDADSYSDVVAADEPLAYFRLSDPMGTAVVPVMKTIKRGKGQKRRRVRRGERTVPSVLGGSGSEGVYVNVDGFARFQQPGLILGDTDTSFRANHSAVYAKAAVERTAFCERNAFSVECWTKYAVDVFAAGPFNTTVGGHIFYISGGGGVGLVLEQVGVTVTVTSVSVPTVGDTIHVVGTWDGSTACIYLNGVLEASESPGGALRQGDANEFIYPVGSSDGPTNTLERDETAFYEHALTAERVMAHYQAGAERGFPQETAESRIDGLADTNLWGAAGAGGQIQVQPVMMAGQNRMDEIAETLQAEGPRAMFFFDGDGNYVHLGHEWVATASRYNTVQATFGNTSGEVPYTDIELVYDDEFYTTVHTSKVGGMMHEASTGVLPDRMLHDYTETLLADDGDVEALAGHVLDFYKDPAFRPVALRMTGEDTTARLQILARRIGDMIRIKHRPAGGTAIDRIVNIIGYTKKLDAETGLLSCTWHLSRGFNGGAAAVWRLGMPGYSELNTTTILG